MSSTILGDQYPNLSDDYGLCKFVVGWVQRRRSKTQQEYQTCAAQSAPTRQPDYFVGLRWRSAQLNHLLLGCAGASPNLLTCRWVALALRPT